jgi:hypothetical protein
MGFNSMLLKQICKTFIVIVKFSRKEKLHNFYKIINFIAECHNAVDLHTNFPRGRVER